MIQVWVKAAGVACFLVAVSAPLRAQLTEVPVEGGFLVLEHPPDWRGVISGPSIGPTLKLTPGRQGDFKVLITALVSRTELPDDAALARQVREQGERLLPTSIQKELDLKGVKGSEARGYVYHLTDRDPEKGPGEFREVHQGAAVVGPLVLGVTILTHSGDVATVEAALATLASARYHPASK